MEEKNAENQNNEEKSEDQTDFTNIEDESPGAIPLEPVEKHGCLKGCLLPIAVMLLIIAVIAILAYPKRDIVRQWLFIRIVSNTQDLVLSNMPEGYDKTEIESTFDKVKVAIKDGTIDEQKIKIAIEEYINNTKKTISDEKRHNEIDKLMKALNESMHPR